MVEIRGNKDYRNFQTGVKGLGVFWGNNFCLENWANLAHLCHRIYSGPIGSIYAIAYMVGRFGPIMPSCMKWPTLIDLGTLKGP